MAGASDPAAGIGVTSWGWQGKHRLWLVASQTRPGESALAAGPTDAIEALIKVGRLARSGRLSLLPWEPVDDVYRRTWPERYE